MSHFFRTLEGATIASDGSERKTRATRGGSAESGLEVLLRSNEGSLKVSVYEGDDGTGGLEDRVRVAFQRVRQFIPAPSSLVRGAITTGEMVGQDFELYNGPISECDYGSIRTNTQEAER